jgi:hypothetical protein|tara:strand:- start:1197 stop:1433 length:237 start_codon:yes stop_codon:yes gene_type:complete
MFVQISKHVKVYITETQIEFIKRMKDKFPMLQTDFEVNDLEVAKILCDKSILVRKKLETNTQYALNRNIRFLRDAIKK